MLAVPCDPTYSIQLPATEPQVVYLPALTCISQTPFYLIKHIKGVLTFCWVQILGPSLTV